MENKTVEEVEEPQDKFHSEGQLFEVYFNEPGVDHLLYFTVWAVSSEAAGGEGLRHIQSRAGLEECTLVEVGPGRKWSEPRPCLPDIFDDGMDDDEDL